MATVTGTDKHLIISGEQIEEAVGKVPTIEADVKSNKQNISALETASAQHTADIAKNTADIEKKANADEVYNKEETDNAITAKVAEIVSGAPKEFDTLKEMSDWLTEHSDSAAEMNTAIQANTKAIADNATAIEGNTAEIANNKSDIEQNKSDISNTRGFFYLKQSAIAEKTFTYDPNTLHGRSKNFTGALLVTLYDWSSNTDLKENLYLVSWNGGVNYIRVQPILANNTRLSLISVTSENNIITFIANTSSYSITPLHAGTLVTQ